MTLLELCEPLFQYICRLNRMSRAGSSSEILVVRAEIKALLEDLQHRAAQDGRLAQQMRKMELPLVFFVDSMIVESQLPFATQWHRQRLAFVDHNELAGDEKFFDKLEETMADSSEEASERLSVFYTCIGLGFVGMYAGQPEYLRKTMLAIAPRIRHLADVDPTSRISPEAYQGVDTRNLVEPPGSKMFLVAMIFLICTLSVTVSYVWMFKRASGELEDSLNIIMKKEK